MRLSFETFCLDVERRELSDGSKAVPIARKAFAVLLYLIENRDRMVPKDELLNAFWPPSISEGVLQTTIHQVRRTLGDDGRAQRFVRTYHGQGFRFIATVSVDAPVAASGSTAPSGARAPPEMPAGAFEERRLATVLACRLSSLEHHSEAEDMESGGDPHGPFLLAGRRTVETNGGTVLHRMPDGFTAVFGAARGLEGTTRHAIECAQALAGSVEARDLRQGGLAVGFGLEVGRFPIVADHADAAFQGLPLRAVTSALAMAELAPHGTAAMSSRAASLLAPALRPHVDANGFLPLDGPVAQAPLPSPPGPNGFTEFVGRGTELGFLRECLRQAGHGHGRCVVLAGDAGIGKTRLLAEFLKAAACDRHRGLTMLTDPRMSNTPLAVMGLLCREVVRTMPAEVVDGLLDDPVDAALWQDLIGDDTSASHPLAGLSTHRRRQRTFRILRDLVARIASQGVTILAFEDIHWMDATSRGALSFLSQSLDGIGVLLIATTRPLPETEAEGVGSLATTSLWLHPLEPHDSLVLVKATLGADRLSRSDTDALIDRAAGNPFYLEELSHAVRAGKGTAAADALPDAVQQVIMARIDGFALPARTLLLAAAVIGPQLTARVLAKTVAWEPPAFESALSDVLSSGVLIEETMARCRGFRFRHVLLQEAAYEMLAREERIALHRRIAHILRDAPGPTPHERLAWHHHEAGDHPEAIDQWTQAARAAQQRSASHEAIEFARNGLRLLSPDTASKRGIRQELELQLTLAPALAAARGYGSDEVGVAYRRARDLSRSASTPQLEFRMIVGLWNFNWVRGDLALARVHAEDLLTLASRAGDPSRQLRAHACMGEILFHVGDAAAATTHLEQACTLFSDGAEIRAATRVPAVACHCYAAWAASFLGRSAAARDFIARAEAIAHELIQPFSMSLYLSLKSELLLFEGDVQGCLDAAREACTICAREGFPFWHGTALVNRGWAEAHSGDPAGGLASLREGIAIFEATGARVQLANWYGLLAEVLLLSGDATAARTAADTAVDWAERTGDRFFLPRIDRTRDALAQGS